MFAKFVTRLSIVGHPRKSRGQQHTIAWSHGEHLLFFLELAGLLVFLFTLHHLPLHLQSLTGLLEVVSAFERLKLALEVLQESLLLLLSQTFILIALLDLLLALFNSLSQMSRIFVHILLEFLLASKHLIVVAVAILQLVLVLRLKCLLL